MFYWAARDQNALDLGLWRPDELTLVTFILAQQDQRQQQLWPRQQQCFSPLEGGHDLLVLGLESHCAELKSLSWRRLRRL